MVYLRPPDPDEELREDPEDEFDPDDDPDDELLEGE